MNKGVRTRNGYYFLDFYYSDKRYRLYTTLTDDPKNEIKADRLLSMLKVDLERNQFYLENYKFKFQNVKILEDLDGNFKQDGKNIKIIQLIQEQVQRYQQMVNVGNLAQSTFDGYCYAINLHLIPYFKDTKLSEVNMAMIESFILRLPFTRRRIKMILRPLQEILKKAKKSGLITTNYIEEIDSDIFKTFATSSDYKISPFTEKEIDLILSATEHETIRNLIATGFYTGLRIGELFALTWENIDLNREVIQVTKAASVKKIIKEPKTKAGIRTIEMIPDAKTALVSQYSITGPANGRVFQTPNGKNWIKTAWFGQYWKKSLALAKVTYRNPYQMRHTFISTMLKLGNSPMVLYPMVGHTNAQIIYQVYGKYIQHHGGKILKTK